MLLEGLIGTATGLLSNFLTTWQNNKSLKLKNEHELKMRDFDIKMIQVQTEAMIRETEANIRITETQVAGEVQKLEMQGETTAFVESIKAGNERALDPNSVLRLYASRWTKPFGVLLTMMLGFCDFMKHFIRPALTVYCVMLATYITYQTVLILNANGRFVETGEALTLFGEAKEIVFYLAVTMATWWFGDRRMAKFMTKNKGQ
ncbi:MAG: hypothetical protein LBV41_04790 [Cytophagaceae bacterium]|jgi:hypothetical protein|nr:hypothetical protein [Cytophagaceae bacterium]